VAVLICCTVAFAPGVARASGTQESVFQDDQYLLYSPAGTVNRTLGVLQALGVQRIRVIVKWSTLAPRAGSRTRPRFDAANPSAYPRGVFSPYDRVLLMAAKHHIGVEFDISAPGPLWAMRHDSPTTRAADHWAPNVSEFTQFVEALGKRYSGSYGTVPRVNFWSVWNEPNQPGWLAPQWRSFHGQQVLNSPRLYREYVEAAFQGLFATGHTVSTDTILVGELAPEGYTTPGYYIATTPMPFLRALYCVDANYRPLRGDAATSLGCPTKGSSWDFIFQNLGLFAATGFAHHPYYFFHPPDYSSPDPDFVPIANLGRLESGLDRAFAAYGLRRQMPLYVTEYGYQTNPPDPFQLVTPSQQAAYLNEADYIAWRDPRVRSVSQFLLYDAKPDTRYPPFNFSYWDTFQTGLLFANGQPKPSEAAYRMPLWIPFPRVRAHGVMLVWGQLRPANHKVTQNAAIQWRPSGGAFRTIAVASTSNPDGYLTTDIRPPGSGEVRIAWLTPLGHVLLSRTVPVTVL
jgi:hypothetical protein